MARRGALLGLVLVATAWGTSFVVVKSTVATVDPASLVGWRFAVAAVALVLVRLRTLRELTADTLRRGLVLGALLSAGFLACTVGLRTTSASTTAFVVGGGVALVPLVGWLWGRRRPGAVVVVAVPVCLAGLGLVTLPGLRIEPGVGLVAVAAACWTVHLVALQQWVEPGRVWASAVVQTSTVAVLAFGMTLATGQRVDAPTAADGVALLFLGVVATAAAFVVLTWSELHVDATTAALVLTLEPVAGALVAAWSGEALTRPVVTGGALVVLAALLAASGASGRSRGRSLHARWIAYVMAWRPRLTGTSTTSVRDEDMASAVARGALNPWHQMASTPPVLNLPSALRSTVGS